MRKLRAADRAISLLYFGLSATHRPPDHGSSLADLVWSLVTDTGNKGNTGKGNTTARPQTTALHSSSLWRSHTRRSRRGLAVVLWCVELHVSTSRTPPHCEGHSPSQWTSQRWGWAIPMPPLPQSGIRVAMALPRDAISLLRNGYCLLSLTLPCTRIRGECSCIVEWNSKEAHPEDEGGVQ